MNNVSTKPWFDYALVSTPPLRVPGDMGETQSWNQLELSIERILSGSVDHRR